jgi:hypothetical protein
LPGSGVLLAAASAAGGAIIATGLSGGNLSQTLKAGLIAGVTAFAFYEVGDLTVHTPSFGSPAYAANVAGHAAVGCASSVASGGECGSGALSGVVGSALSPLTSQLFQNPQGNLSDGIGGTIVSSVVGGLASEAGDGKFANGAITGAFGYLFNVVAGGVGRMLDGQDAHRALQIWLERQGIDSLFTESSTDGLGTSFWGRVDIGIRLQNSIWDIKSDNMAGLLQAHVMAEFYSMTAVGPTEYHPGGDLRLPAGPLQGARGSYTYVNGGDGAILWNSYRSATAGYSFSHEPAGGPFALPPSVLRFLLR